MNAIVCEKYGSPEVLQLKEVVKPAPKDHEVLVKVSAVSLNAYDWHLLTADIFMVRLMGGGLVKPKCAILGADIAGRVEAVGREVTQFRAGDDVFGDISMCGTGGLAEYACAPEERFAPKPKNLSFEEAAAVPMAALTALQGLRDRGHIQSGQKVLIHGASGGVGTYAIQLAKWFGAEVTGVCSSRNLEQAVGLGADHVINYEREDFAQQGARYDLILAVNGYRTLLDYQRALIPTGRYVMAGGKGAQIFEAMLLGPFVSKLWGKKMGGVSAAPNQKDLYFLKELFEFGKLKAVVDRRFPLSETAEAFRYLGTRHARGKIVVTV